MERDPVLVVEDHPDTREALAMVLSMHGFPVAEAGDGRMALDSLRAGLHPCLILLDLHMPHMDGFEFRREQRRDPALCDTPVVVYSGHYDVREAAESLGVEDYFQKPFDMETVVDKVERNCRRR